MWSDSWGGKVEKQMTAWTNRTGRRAAKEFMFGFAISFPRMRVLKGKCVSPHWGAEPLLQHARLCSDLLTEADISRAALQVFVCMCIRGCALFYLIFCPLAWPCLCLSKTLNVGVCWYAGGHRKVSQLHNFSACQRFLNKHNHADLRRHESDVTDPLT